MRIFVRKKLVEIVLLQFHHSRLIFSPEESFLFGRILDRIVGFLDLLNFGLLVLQILVEDFQHSMASCFLRIVIIHSVVIFKAFVDLARQVYR